MVFLFGIGEQVSVITHERFLTHDQQAKATMVLNELPVPESKEGFYHVLYINPVTKQLSYVYKEKTAEMNRMEKLQQLLNDGKITFDEFAALQ